MFETLVTHFEWNSFSHVEFFRTQLTILNIEENISFVIKQNATLIGEKITCDYSYPANNQSDYEPGP